MLIRSLVVGAALVVLVAVPARSAAAPTTTLWCAPTPGIPEPCAKPFRRPPTKFQTPHSGVGTIYFERLKWKGWSTRRAVAIGRTRYHDDQVGYTPWEPVRIVASGHKCYKQREYSSTRVNAGYLKGQHWTGWPCGG